MEFGQDRTGLPNARKASGKQIVVVFGICWILSYPGIRGFLHSFGLLICYGI